MEKEQENLIEVVKRLPMENVKRASDEIIGCLKKGNKIMICGNGGSAGDAQHFAAELVCTFHHRNRKGLPCLALTCNTSSLTAWANDFDYNTVFARQVEAYGKEGDILFSITTSGNSKNILEAMSVAKTMGIKNILLTGKDGGLANKQNPDIAIIVPSSETPRIQECHIFIIHHICNRVDEAFKDAQTGVNIRCNYGGYM